LARELKVNIVGDSSDLERAFARSERAAKKFNRAITGALGAGIAGVGFAKLAQDTIKSASNLAESVSKTEAVFGQSAGAIKDWAKTTATAFGISERAALETASGFGALFGPLGIVGQAAADQSRKLTELGADLASFYNTDVQSALDAIRSGLVGESEPLRRYGALLSETRVQQEAMAETGKKNATSLTDQEKVLARIALIFEDTTVAQGDFAKTSGNLAGQLKILQAQTSDLQAEIGTLLLPKIIELTTEFNRWLADPEHKKEVIDGFTASIQALGDAASFAAGTVKTLNSIWDALPNIGKHNGLLDYLPPIEGPGFTIGGGRYNHGPGGGFSAPGHAGGAGGRGGLPGTTPADRQGVVDNMLAQVRSWVAAGQGITAVNQINAFIDKYTAMGKKWEDTQKAMAARRAAAELKRQRFAAGLENQWGWLQFGEEKAGATKRLGDDRRILKKQEAWLKNRIAHAGRTLQLVSELWRVQQKIRDLGKNKGDKDPLAGLMQVSSKRLAQVLAAGTGIGPGGMGRLEANIAGQEIHNYVILDGRQVAHSVNTHQTRGSARTARQTSGFRG
jgi:hypothetical protein